MITNTMQEWRGKHGGGKPVSQAHLARQIKVSRSYITKLEHNQMQPSAEVMFRIAAYFKCRVEDVFHHTQSN